MNHTINYGIDLGTTNSAIAKFVKGDVIIFANPQDYGRTTLPSVVAFRKDKIIVGSKARELVEKDPRSVIGTFKRKMGTAEVFTIDALQQTKTPVELSAIILKELKTFVHSDHEIQAAVITIPASFDTVQSNATMEAGLLAGFNQVVLLQEPIAASLAYANMKHTAELSDGQWLVYDLGGGTFDVALIKIINGEMKVLDHEGDNFLGGADFDNLIVEQLVIPRLAAQYQFNQLEADLKSASGRLNAHYYVLLKRAEEAKLLLSSKTVAELVIDGFDDEAGNPVDLELIITRAEFNDLIRASIDNTVQMIRTMLRRNALQTTELQFVLMVGGSTYIPYIRSRVEAELQIAINCAIDPTTAVAIGAAYYAATKPILKITSVVQNDRGISIKTSYSKASREKEELFSARFSGRIDALNYRIIRHDGGFDSGIKKLTERISEDLPLVEGVFNFFTLTLYDEQGNVVEAGMEPIGINSGFGINGQPIPEDISVEIDDHDYPGQTKLQLLFQKNTLLPLKKTLSFPLNKSLAKGAVEDVIRVNVVEGSHLSLPEANKTIGYMQIAGTDVSRAVSKGSDIEITVTMSESRDLTIAAYLSMADQEFTQTFNAAERNIPISELKAQVAMLAEKVTSNVKDAEASNDTETATTLTELKEKVELVQTTTSRLTDDDVTDKRYQLEDARRKLAQEVESATRLSKMNQVKKSYYVVKEHCRKLLDQYGLEHEHKAFHDLVAQEAAFLEGESHVAIHAKADELIQLVDRIRWRLPEYHVQLFQWCKSNEHNMHPASQAQNLLAGGELALSTRNWNHLFEVNRGLLLLLHNDVAAGVATRIGFGW